MLLRAEQYAFGNALYADHPASANRSGSEGMDPASILHTVVAYLGDEPAGWCAVEPRTAYERLRYNRVPWTGRVEDKADDTVWSVTCFFTRVGYRKRGVASTLARATVDFARDRGARAVEGYPMTVKNVIVDELHVGTERMFLDAGYREVSRPALRRVVMRVDF